MHCIYIHICSVCISNGIMVTYTNPIRSHFIRIYITYRDSGQVDDIVEGEMISFTVSNIQHFRSVVNIDGVI